MMVDLSKLIYDKMVSHQFVMSVMGNLNQQLLKSLMKATEQKLDSYETDDCIKKRIFHFMVECAQNICKTCDTEQKNQDALFLIGKQDDKYAVYLASVFRTEHADRIVEVIETVNRLPSTEVKSQFYSELSGKPVEYQDQLLMSMLDISKRTKRKISYELNTIDASHKFLSFITVIGN